MNVIGAAPTYSLDAEHKVLGACLVSEDALGTAIERLEPEDFYDKSNRILFETLSAMFLADNPIDAGTVIAELRKRNILDRMGGLSFVIDLTNEVTTTTNIEFYVEALRETSQRRKLLDTGRKITNLAQSPDITNEQVISQASQLLLDASENKFTEEFTTIKDTVTDGLASIKSTDFATKHYYTSLQDIDNLTGGLTPGALTILAARPSMGKTALALNFAQFGSSISMPVVIFSLEMPAKQLALRMLSAQSGVNLAKIINRTLTTADFTALELASEELAKRQIFISDNSALSTTDFMIKARRFKTKHPDTGLIIVDYLQMMTAGRRIDSRVLEVSEISRTLKAVARELNVPVLALSQLSRAPESRPDKKPQLADLRDSGAIEQDADLVMMLYREDYYGDNENSDLADSKADLRVAKNRNGATGVVHLTFKREITRFVNFGEE